MKNYLNLQLTFLFLVLFGVTYGQFTLTGRVLDGETNEPLSHARVVLQGTNTRVLADEKGHFSIPFDDRHRQVSFSYLGYERRLISLPAADTTLEVVLAVDPVSLSEVTIRENKPELFHRDDQSYILDYEFLGDHLLIMKMDPADGQPRVLLLNLYQEVLAEFKGPEPVRELYRDCLGNVHVVGEEYACQVDWYEGMLVYSRAKRTIFEDRVRPCVGNADVYFYRKEVAGMRQIVSYFYTADHLDSLYPFETIANLKMLNAAALRVDAFRQIVGADPENLDGGMMGELSIDDLRKIRGLQVELQFLEEIWLYPLFAPLRVVGKKVFIFDHLNGLVREYDSKGQRLRDIPIAYHKKRNWERFIHLDEVRGEVYTQFVSNGYVVLRQISLKDGTLSGRWTVPLPFAENIQIVDGDLFYLCRDQDDAARKRLYRWRIS